MADSEKRTHKELTMFDMKLPITTIKEHNFKKNRMLAWDFKTGNWAKKPPLTQKEKTTYYMLQHDVAALYYVAHQNIKSYKVLCPLLALVQLGLMVGFCAEVRPTPEKIVSLIALPLLAATIMNRKDTLIKRAQQAKSECHEFLTRFEKFEQVPPITAPLGVEYPSVSSQRRTIRGVLLMLNPNIWRHKANLGLNLWKKERQNG